MTPIAIFEEWRFLFELIASMLAFVLPYCHFQKRNLLALLSLLLLLMAFSLCYFPIRDLALWASTSFASTALHTLAIRILFFCGWYLSLVFVSLFFLRWLFAIPKKDLIFITLAGFSLQHIVFVLVHEIIVQTIWPKVTQHLWLYSFLALIATLIIIYPVYWFFKPEMNRNNRGNLVKSQTSQKVYIVMLIVLILQAFAGQYIFNNATGPVRYISALSSVALCLLILYSQFATLHASNLIEDQFVMEHLLKERKKQYQLEKEAVQHINHRVHDFKNQILALQNMKESEKGAYFQDILHNISHYDQVLNLENESLNTLLTQKHHQCQLKKIQFSHMIDGETLQFLSLLDIYTILGNALDNAIDCVQDYTDPADRQISLHIKQHKQFVVLEVVNRFLGTLNVDPENQLPKSTKQEHDSHGFGLKSIQTTLEKYNGWLSIHTENRTFLLTVMIPIPQQKETSS